MGSPELAGARSLGSDAFMVVSVSPGAIRRRLSGLEQGMVALVGMRCVCPGGCSVHRAMRTIAFKQHPRGSSPCAMGGRPRQLCLANELGGGPRGRQVDVVGGAPDQARLQAHDEPVHAVDAGVRIARVADGWLRRRWWRNRFVQFVTSFPCASMLFFSTTVQS